MVQLNQGKPQPLQYVANAAFLASLYVDYLNASGAPGFTCGPNFITLAKLRSFATSQVSSSLFLYLVLELHILGKAANISIFSVGFAGISCITRLLYSYASRAESNGYH